MPPSASSDNPPQSQSQSQSQLRPNLSAHHRSTSSVTSQQPESPAGTPPATQHKPKDEKTKHHVGGGRKYGRVSSTNKLSRQVSNYSNNNSHDNLKEFRKKNNSSTNLLRKNNSQTALKRNRSSADVQPNTQRRPKSADGTTDAKRTPASVHFEIGTPGKAEAEVDEGWEEASSSASPALSRSASTIAKPSAPNSTANSRHQSPLPSPSPKFTTNGTGNVAAGGGLGSVASTRHSNADAKIITEKLLQRTPSHHATTPKMSMTTATPTPLIGHTPSSSVDRATAGGVMGGKSVGPGTASGNQELISRFVSGSGTPGESSPNFNQVNHEAHESRTVAKSNGKSNGNGELGRARSMGNLARHNDVDEEEESALLPRSRKSSTAGVVVPPNAYNSRTQQKLWLQRASSNIEPAREGMGSLSMLNGGGGGMGMGGGNMYDGRDPRIKVQLERTGLEYLVVRRYQNPVGRSIKRLEKMGLTGKSIPSKGVSSTAPSRNGSLRERNGNVARKSIMKQSFEDERNSSGDEAGKNVCEDEGIGALLRSLWDKNFEGVSGSAD